MVKQATTVFAIVGIIQIILHYLGLGALIFGVIAVVSGNLTRGKELILSGIIYFAIKYAVGAVYVAIILHKNKATPRTLIDLVNEAIPILHEEGVVTPQLLKSRLNIDYPTAARILDTLEDMDLIDPPNGSAPRKARTSK